MNKPVEKVADHYSELSITDLKALIDEADLIIKEQNDLKKEIEAHIWSRYEDQVKEELANKPDHCGTVNLGDVKYNAAKRVSWDQDILSAKVEELKNSGQDVTDYVETSYKLTESKYKELPKSAQEWFAVARTVKVSPPKLSFNIKE